MSIDRRIAHFVVHKRRRAFVIAAGLLLLSGALMACFLRMDAEILNLLPDEFGSVRALKVFNRDFSQVRELVFAVHDRTGKADLDGFKEHFVEALKKEPWVVRVLDRSPMENSDGMQSVQQLALPLLFNLPEAEFQAAISNLEPEAIAKRLSRMRADIEAGSMRAEVQLSLDPLGIVVPALKPLATSFSMETTQPLVSPDRTVHLVFVMTNQGGLDPFSCRDMMDKVDALRTKVLASWNGEKPELLVTGRTPYVAEMSRGMEHDIVWTVLGSIVLVASIFYFGFRRFVPLVGIMHALFFCCVLSVAAGTLVFRNLNGIAVGFCSILVGLAVDFGMLLYGAYVARRDAGDDHETAIAESIRKLGRGICFGASTTAAGFLALLLSGCPGFSQLGVLIAFGIVFAALTMMTVFFAMLPSTHVIRTDLLSKWGAAYVDVAARHSKPIAISVLVLLIIAAVIAFAPIGRLQFHANPRSLEPAGSMAGKALRLIQEGMTNGNAEPVLVIISARNAEEFHDRWNAAQRNWAKLVKEGKLKAVNTPAAFALSPRLIDANRRFLSGKDFSRSVQAMREGLEREGFSVESFSPGFATLEALGRIANGGDVPGQVSAALPGNSPWRFVLDKFLGADALTGVAYVIPKEPLGDFETQRAFEGMLQVEGVSIHPTGWTFMLNELVPWARTKLTLLSSVMIAFNIALLVFLYRRWAPLLTLMFSLVLSICAMVATLKLFQIPLNLFNVLAFPLVLGVGVDYGIYVLLAIRDREDPQGALKMILKPVILSGLTSIAGFASLCFSYNPSLSGLGLVCGIGVAWSLAVTMFLIVPAHIWRRWR